MPPAPGPWPSSPEEPWGPAPWDSTWRTVSWTLTRRPSRHRKARARPVPYPASRVSGSPIALRASRRSLRRRGPPRPDQARLLRVADRPADTRARPDPDPQAPRLSAPTRKPQTPHGQSTGSAQARPPELTISARALADITGRESIMSTPRALNRAKAWTAGAMLAATLVTGGVGLTLIQDSSTGADTSGTAAQSTATTAGSSTTDSSSSSSTSSTSSTTDSSSSTSSSGFSSTSGITESSSSAQTTTNGS
mgnify:CR=1 FL=1